MTKLTGDGEIYDKNNKVIGHIQWEDNVLVDMWIDEEYRGYGHGKKSVNQMVEYIIKNNEYNYIKTTTVLNNCMESVLFYNGFKPLSEVNLLEYNHIEDNIDVTNLPQDTKKVRNNNVWIKIID